MSQVKVSVIIPTYKRSEDLCRAVDSVLAQTLNDLEVIVVDDNGIGTEGGIKTAEVMAQYSDNDRVVYLQHEVNKNGSAARNTGIRAAKGEYVAFLDDDDAFLPERLEKMVARMEQLDDSWGGCYTGYVKHMPSGKDQYSSERCEGNIFLQVLMRSFYLGSGSNLFFRRSVIDKVGEFNEQFRRNQDLEYLVRVCHLYKMAYVDEVLMEVFYDIRTVRLTHQQTVERETLFRDNFRPYLADLSKKEKRAVLIMYNIDWIRYLINRKKWFSAIITALKARIPLYVYVNYFKYIRDRQKNRTCYGFVVTLK